jgi:hypothetical protein
LNSDYVPAMIETFTAQFSQIIPLCFCAPGKKLYKHGKGIKEQTVYSTGETKKIKKSYVLNKEVILEEKRVIIFI